MREELRSLLEFIGNGYFHTYPQGDENKRKFFAMCLELEKLGLITRHRDEDDWVVWALETGKVPARMGDDGEVWRFAVMGAP